MDCVRRQTLRKVRTELFHRANSKSRFPPERACCFLEKNREKEIEIDTERERERERRKRRSREEKEIHVFIAYKIRDGKFIPFPFRYDNSTLARLASRELRPPREPNILSSDSLSVHSSFVVESQLIRLCSAPPAANPANSAKILHCLARGS